ncbi:glutaredoxin-like protein C5orf63 homolog [Phymastichus coffea]|uniref:glutaredoxin-like protein C5orf63 homolog n=1 Tax=Phymastichus coffea TaxID=108790 RepID=UPI00273C7ED5|nr:glutaredoxin-like protein C5orf63 homolog [Phymastichus coffea]
MMTNISHRSSSYSNPPKLTLYTKNVCPLCDVVKDELKSKFSGRYQLELVDIMAPGNEHLKKLYKYDIPVLFVEGQYLCKHRLDADLLERRLADLA